MQREEIAECGNLRGAAAQRMRGIRECLEAREVKEAEESDIEKALCRLEENFERDRLLRQLRCTGRAARLERVDRRLNRDLYANHDEYPGGNGP
jgi:hypothetical protein